MIRVMRCEGSAPLHEDGQPLAHLAVLRFWLQSRPQLARDGNFRAARASADGRGRRRRYRAARPRGPLNPVVTILEFLAWPRMDRHFQRLTSAIRPPGATRSRLPLCGYTTREVRLDGGRSSRCADDAAVACC